MKKDNKDNVIDMTERMTEPAVQENLKHLKVRFDLERAKVGLSASILSIVILVTLANNRMMKDEAVAAPSRGIASVPTGTSDEEDSLVRELARKDLSASATVGQRPSAIEKLAFGFLEGQYAIRLHNGKLSELERSGEQGKQIDDMGKFFETNRDVMPVAFDKPVKVARDDAGDVITETWQLVNGVSRPVASVQVRMDGAGNLINLRVSSLQLASK